MATEQQYWAAIQARVCAKCIDGDGKGGCRLSQGTDCALEKYFPQIIEVIGSIRSGSIEPYIALLRNKICGVCINQSGSGVCSMRNEVDCALDRYYPLIVEVIEETQVRERLRM